jgi:ABC-type xylose transport system substrate-binding protein
MTAHQSAQKDKKGNIIIQITDEDMKRWVTEITRLRHKTGEQVMRYQPVKSLENKYSDIMML